MRLKKYLSASIVLFLIIITMAPCLAKENNTEIKTSGPCGKGYRYNIQGWVYIHIEGEPYERGYQYGYLAFFDHTILLSIIHLGLVWL